MAQLISTNPGKNYEEVGRVEATDLNQVQEHVALAQAAAEPWRKTSIAKRIDHVSAIHQECLNRRDEIAKLTVQEIGQPISFCNDILDWDLSYFQHFIDKAEQYLAPQTTASDEQGSHHIVYEPLGVSATIVPWNFPFMMFLWGVIPNLLAGNTVVFKHSEECPLSGKLLEEIVQSTSLPEGVFAEVYGDGQVGEALARAEVDLIWFTGSTNTGKHLYRIAAERFVKALLEMGGSNPAIVFEDTNLESVAAKLMAKRFGNCGQACDALKRVLVHESKFEELVQRLKGLIEELIIGEPENPETQLGPLVAQRQLELLQAQVKDAVEKGATIVAGGSEPANLQGAYYLPTLITDVPQDSRVWREETFGPVLPIVPFSSEDEAIKLANDTPYGLGALVFSEDLDKAQRVANRLDAGTVEINSGNHWNPENPFGGMKDSGMGREHGQMGFHELCEAKVVSIA